MRLVLLMLVLLLAACAGPERVRTVETKVPVSVRAAPPDELAAPYVPPETPAFVAPSHQDAVVALTEEGAQALKGLILDLNGRLAAWRAWAFEGLPPPD